MKSFFFKNIKFHIFLFSAVLLLVFNQNCSKDQVFNSSSIAVLCQKKLQELGFQKLAANNQVNCEESFNYACEVRRFAEGVENNSSTAFECLKVDGQEFCLPIVFNVFDSSSARKVAGVTEQDFAPGGDYNRYEYQCSYFSDETKKEVLLTSSGSNLNETISLLVNLCRSKAKTNDGAPL